MSSSSDVAAFFRGAPPRGNAGRVRVDAKLRAVGAPGAPWVRVDLGGRFADARGAREAVRALAVPDEPSVLRVSVRAGSRRTPIPDLIGDWLCDTSVDPTPVYLGLAKWVWTYVAPRAWAEGRPWLEAWELCLESSWAVDFASAAGVPLELRRRAIFCCGQSYAGLAGSFTGLCRAFLAAAEACVDAAERDGDSAPRRDDGFRRLDDRVESAIREAGRRSSGSNRPILAVRGVADTMLLDPALWAPPNARDCGYVGVERRHGALRFDGDLRLGDLRLADVVRRVIPAIEVLRGLAAQNIGEDPAPP